MARRARMLGTPFFKGKHSPVIPVLSLISIVPFLCLLTLLYLYHHYTACLHDSLTRHLTYSIPSSLNTAAGGFSRHCRVHLYLRAAPSPTCFTPCAAACVPFLYSHFISLLPTPTLLHGMFLRHGFLFLLCILVFGFFWQQAKKTKRCAHCVSLWLCSDLCAFVHEIVATHAAPRAHAYFAARTAHTRCCYVTLHLFALHPFLVWWVGGGWLWGHGHAAFLSRSLPVSLSLSHFLPSLLSIIYFTVCSSDSLHTCLHHTQLHITIPLPYQKPLINTYRCYGLVPYYLIGM